MNLYAWRNRLQRLARAWRYAIGGMTTADAHAFVFEAQPVAGYAILETLDVESVAEFAEELFGAHDGLQGWASDAVARVGYKWGGTGDIQSAASDWAIDLIREYAAQDGVTLVETDA